jgi:hypothetical protein
VGVVPGLTPPSRGRPASGPPLTSNVSRLSRPYESLVCRSLGCCRAAHLSPRSLASAATGFACCSHCNGCHELAPSFTPQQACGAGPNESALLHPLPLSCSGRGQRRGHRAAEDKEPIHQRVAQARQEHLPGGQDQQPHGSLQATFPSGPVGSSLSSSITPPWCLLPVRGQGWQRLAAKAAHPVKGWQTQAFGGLLNTQPANPSVKGTGLRPAPYVER